MKLSELKENQSAKIVKMDNSEKIKNRLNCMGITEGVVISVIAFAPFNGPVKIKARDGYFALRKKETYKITVQRYE